MIKHYGQDFRYNRYGSTRRQSTQRSRGPVSLLIISGVMLTATVVLAAVTFGQARQGSANTLEVPTPTPQVITVDNSSEMAGNMQALIDQAVAGDISQDTVNALVSSGVSESSINDLAAMIENSAQSGAYIDGVYQGTGQGENGTIKAEVTIKDGRIFYIAVIAHSEKGAVTKDVFEPIAITVMENQSADGVDAISGATAISDGYIEAIIEALSQAK